jgi:hypothetical protein
MWEIVDIDACLDILQAYMSTNAAEYLARRAPESSQPYQKSLLRKKAVDPSHLSAERLI